MNVLAETLRTATRAAHRALDHHPLLAPLVCPGLTHESYARALAALHGPQAACEARLAGFAPADDFPPRLPDLEADLASLGVAPMPLCAEMPPPATAAERIGIMYVLEGSNLGGAAIARRLEKTLAPDLPRAFFSGAGGAPRWERFWHFAAAYSAPEWLDQACAAACATFEFYRRHLDGCLGQ